MNAEPGPRLQGVRAAPAIKRAMILAAGFGLRMRPLTDTLPKPLVKVQGRALIDHALDRLEAAGVEEVVVNVHYRADQMEAHLAERRSPHIIVSDERAQLLDTGGGALKALPHFKGEAFFYLNSDSIWREGTRDALADMRASWDEKRMDALMLLASSVRSTGYDGLGDFMMDAQGRLTPRPEKRVAPFIWAGVQIIHPRAFEGAPAGPFSTWRIWSKAIEARRLFGIRLDGLWMHIGSPDGLRAAEDALAQQ
jgi:N-acetyl-alpha-D-muramate 1-phosphate uridylyltransferase